jgi:heme-degrading monooxygenase HmoA
MAILRIWKGVVRSADEAAYLDFVRATGMRDYRATQGNLGALLVKRATSEGVEVATLTLWESLDAIERFAGKDVTLARYYPEDDRFLASRPERVEHYEIADGSIHESLGGFAA